MSATRTTGTRPPPAFVLRTVLQWRARLASLRRKLAPPSATIFETSLALADTAAMRVLAELEIPDHLDAGPRTSAEMASACGADPDSLHRVLRFLVGRGLLDDTRDGRFRNNRISSLVRRDDPQSMRELALFAGDRLHVHAWEYLTDAVRTGTSAARIAHRQSFFELMQENVSLATHFDGAMAELSRLQADVVLRAHDFSTASRVCDVGGGTGTLLAEVLLAHPHLHGTLFDVPEVAGRGRAEMKERGLAARVDVVGGDFFAGVPPASDRYLLQSVVHDWDDESCVAILANIRAAMGAGARVLVIEQVLSDERHEVSARTLDLEMLVVTEGGRERTSAEYSRLFERAALKIERTHDSGLITVFELATASH